MQHVEHLKKTDPELARIVEDERKRQLSHIELIASENFVSSSVLEAAGTVLTNKYAEGYPGRRYYGGCDVVDRAENLARERAKELFGADHVNVQPHSGSQANMGVYFTTLEPGDKVLGMNLAHGGHLTHGSPVNFSGDIYEFIPYGVDRETERVDFDALRELAHEHKPKLIVAGASAYPRELPFDKFREIADEVGAYLMVDMAHIAGLIATGEHQTPVGHAQFITTTTHKTLRGPRGGMILCDEEFGRDIDRAIFPGIQGGPLMHIIAAKAACLGEALAPSFKVYQRQIVANARALAEALVDHGFRLVSGGTDTHLMLLDLNPKNITGKKAEALLDTVGITVNKNTIPFETRSPFVTSGIRIGTPAVTTRGMKEEEMGQIAELIAETIEHRDDDAKLRSIEAKVKNLCSAFPLHAE